MREKDGKNIYCDGGVELVFELLKYSLIDTLVISVIPFLVVEGTRLFKSGRPEQKLELKKSLNFPSGLVLLWYEKSAVNQALSKQH